MFLIRAAVVPLCAAIIFGCGGGNGAPDETQAEDRDAGTSAYQGLRAMALGAAELDLPSGSGSHPDVVGVVIDIPEEGEFATLAALSDGATSLYTSVGGGIIGGGEHERVARANARLLDEAQVRLPDLPADDSTDHPPAGIVRIFVVTPNGRRVADIPEDDFWTSGRGRFASIVTAAQRVLTELRRVDPK